MIANLTLAYYAALQEIRNYRFFYILAVSILLTLGFVPPQDASYTTISFSNWQPLFNSEWIGTTTAIMSTLLLSIFGFYLIIDNISKDKLYRTHGTITVSQVSNFRYLLYRMLSASFMLISILVLSMIVSILLSMYYNGFSETSFLAIILPYIYIAVPSAFVIATLAIVLEVLLPNRRMLRYFIFLFGFIAYLASSYDTFSDALDPLGIQYTIHHLFENVKQITQEQIGGYTIGLSMNRMDETKQVFEYAGTQFSSQFVWGRLLIIAGSIFLIGLVSLIFNRLRFFQNKSDSNDEVVESTAKTNQAKFNLEPMTLTPLEASISLRDNILAEIFLYQKWTKPIILILTLCLLLASFLLNLGTVHRFVLPLIILLQVPVLSDMLTRDKRLRTDIFFKTSVISDTFRLFYKGIAALFILSALSLPVIIRFIIGGEFLPAASILVGLTLIILISFLFAILFQSKKPFELFMILVTYACMNQIEVVDYLGIYTPTGFYLIIISSICILLALIVLFSNNINLKNE